MNLKEAVENVESGRPVFSVYDSKGEFFERFYDFKSKGEALRWFQDMANDKKTRIGLHPEDYSLFLIGFWNENKGIITPVTHISLGIAIQYVQDVPVVVPQIVSKE